MTDPPCDFNSELYTHTCSHEYTRTRTGAYDLEEQMRKEICEEEMPEGGAGVPLRGKSRARQVCVSVCVCVCFAATCIHYIPVGGMFACVFTCMSAVNLRLALHQMSPILHLTNRALCIVNPPKRFSVSIHGEPVYAKIPACPVYRRIRVSIYGSTAYPLEKKEKCKSGSYGIRHAERDRRFKSRHEKVVFGCLHNTCIHLTRTHTHTCNTHRV